MLQRGNQIVLKIFNIQNILTLYSKKGFVASLKQSWTKKNTFDELKFGCTQMKH